MKVLVKYGKGGLSSDALVHIYDDDMDRAVCGRLWCRSRVKWRIEERRPEEIIGSKELCYHCEQRSNDPDVAAKRVSTAHARWLEKLEAWETAVGEGDQA